jgi:hypothetical protein
MNGQKWLTNLLIETPGIGKAKMAGNQWQARQVRVEDEEILLH